MQATQPSGQETDGESLAEKRARWEHLRLAPCIGAGKVNVCNYSYGVQAKNDHTHTVSVESGIPFDCTCPDWQYNNPEDGCKHMIAVSNAPDIMAEAQPDVATDGGTDDDDEDLTDEDKRFLLPEHDDHVSEDEVDDEATRNDDD